MEPNYLIIYEQVTWIITSLLIIIAKWIVFKKAWEKWWKAIIPLYNDYVLFKIAWRKKWFWWILIPPIYVFVKIAALFDLSKKFWKKNWFALWLSFIPVIFFPILAWWKAKYDDSKKMKWTIFWRVIAIIMWIIWLFVWAFVLALFNPGNEKIDNIRLKIQTPMMKFLSDYLIDWRANNWLWLIDEHNFHDNDDAMISWEDLQPYIDTLQRWDIMFTDWARYISSIVIPWTRKHALIYLGNWEIIDATSKWVTTWLLEDLDNLSRGSLLKEIIAFRPNLTEEQREEFIQFAFDQLGKPYDFDYNKEDKDAYYCSELVADWLAKVGLDITYESKSIWKMVVSPEDAVKYVQEIWLDNWEYENVFWLAKEWYREDENSEWEMRLVDKNK